jgi:hypothetical protein
VKLLKIDTEGTISEFNTPGSPDELLPDLKEVFGNWVEVVSLPVVFNGYGQLIGLVNDVGAIDENTLPNSLATQFYRSQNKLIRDQNGRQVMLWGDVYFATLDYTNPDSTFKSLPNNYTPEDFAQLLGQLIVCKDRFLLM